MNQMQKDVQDFHLVCEIPVTNVRGLLTQERMELRRELIKEEAKELRDALKEKDEVEIIDGMCDLIVVTLGTAVEMGVDLQPFWDEVHRSNMTKVGGPKRADGKALKPEHFRPPDIEAVLASTPEII